MSFFQRSKPLTILILCGIFAVSSPTWLQNRLRGGAAWCVTPLWSWVAHLHASQDAEVVLREKIRVLELENLALRTELQDRSTSPTTSSPQWALRARVIARDPGSWTQAAWIDVGRNNTPEGSPLQRNSPVVLGQTLIGMVEYVGRSQSLVRLLSDPHCCPSLEIVGRERDGIADAASRLALLLSRAEGEGNSQALQMLESLSRRRGEEISTVRGVLRGMDGQASHCLRGQLYLGEIAWKTQSTLPSAGALIQTSGNDGIFPRGLRVAALHSIRPPRPGEVAREFLALPEADLEGDLYWVTVLAPRSTESKESPPPPWLQEILKGTIPGISKST